MCRTPQAERCRPLHGRLRASALRLRPKSELFNLIISSCRIALRKERKQWRPLPNRHSRCVIAQRALVSALAAFRRARSFGAFGSSQKKENVRQKQPILISSTSRTSDWVSPARSGFTTFCHQKVVPKVSARRKAAGNSQRLAKTGACRGFASKPAPFFNARRCSFLFPHFSQGGDCCALRATMILISFFSVLAGLRPAGSHCENSGSSDGTGASARSNRD